MIRSQNIIFLQLNHAIKLQIHFALKSYQENCNLIKILFLNKYCFLYKYVSYFYINLNFHHGKSI